jgi:hypothetical protein
VSCSVSELYISSDELPLNKSVYDSDISEDDAMSGEGERDENKASKVGGERLGTSSPVELRS